MSSSKQVLQRRLSNVALASLAATLSMGISHKAMAACTGIQGTTIVCQDTSTIPFNNIIDFSTTGVSVSDGNYSVKVTATDATDGTATVTNSKTVSATLNTLSATNTAFGIYGMKGADSYGIEEWNLDNSGTISASHKGIGVVAGVFLQDDAEAWNINNTGTISVTRGALTGTATSAPTSNATSGAITAKDAFGNSGTLGVAAAVYNNEEEIRDHNIVNDGSIIATGQYTAAIFTRSNSFELVNNGTINGYETAPVVNSSGEVVTPGVTGTAAAIVTWDGRLLKQLPDAEIANCTSPGNVCTGREAGFGKSFIKNNGDINGNIIITGLNGLQVMGRIGTGADPITLNGVSGAPNPSSTPVGLPSATVSGGMVDRRDSEFENNGTIVGNFYYGNGAHVLSNTDTGTIKGDVVVDMRRVTNYLDANNYSATLSTGSAHNDAPYSVYVAGRSATFGEAEEGDDDDDDDNAQPGKVYTSDPGLSYGAAMADAAAKLVADNPDRHFTFENAGVFDGNLSILTVNHQFTDTSLLANAVSTVTITPQTVDLKPHITGSGIGSSKNDPSDGSGYINGRLFIGDGSMAGWTVTPATLDGSSSTISADGAGGSTKTTVTPVIDHIVHSGEWFLVAKELYGDKLPGIEGDTALVTWDIAKNINKSLVVGSTVADADTIDGLSKPGIATINALMANDGSDDEVNELGAAVQRLTSEDDVRKAGEQLKPETNFATQQAAITLNNAVGQHIDTRLASAGGTGSYGQFAKPSGLGMGSDDPNRSNLGGGLKDDGDYVVVTPKSNALWAQGFGASMDQDERDAVDGYTARLYGFLAGYDNWISPNVRLGIAGGYANTNIDGSGDTRQNSTGIDSYLVEAYGSIKGAGWYASGRTGYTWHNYDTVRALTVPFTDTADGSHDGSQFNAAVEVGAPMRMSGAILTPVASLTYSNLHQDSYTETSGGGMALSVDSQDNDSLVSGLGLKALIPLEKDTVIEGRALWLHEFSDTAQVVQAAFAGGGGGVFTAAGPSVGRDTAALGIGLLAQVDPGMTFQINYDANIREDYLAHVGSGRLNIDF